MIYFVYFMLFVIILSFWNLINKIINNYEDNKNSIVANLIFHIGMLVWIVALIVLNW